jgi:hypothetical protein
MTRHSIAYGILVVGALLLFTYVFFSAIWMIFAPVRCDDNEIVPAYRQGDVEVTFVETLCDGFGSTDVARIYLREIGYFTRRQLVFTFEPTYYMYKEWTSYPRLPSADIRNDGTIVIHLEKISEPDIEMRTWNGRNIEYDIEDVIP